MSLRKKKFIDFYLKFIETFWIDLIGKPEAFYIYQTTKGTKEKKRVKELLMNHIDEYCKLLSKEVMVIICYL